MGTQLTHVARKALYDYIDKNEDKIVNGGLTFRQLAAAFKEETGHSISDWTFSKVCTEFGIVRPTRTQSNATLQLQIKTIATNLANLYVDIGTRLPDDLKKLIEHTGE